MKKILIAVIFIVFLAGCTNDAKIDLNAVLVVDNGQLDAAKDINDNNLISGKPQCFYDKNVTNNYSKLINGIEYELEYKESLNYSVGCKTLHSYIVNGDEENTVLIDESGNINSLFYDFARLNIRRTATPEEVLELLRAELSKIFDITYYKNVKIPDAIDNVDRFGIYDYVFYNKTGEYMTDHFRVSVSDDGSVFALSIDNLSATDFKLNVDKNKENAIVELKLKEMYNTQHTRYLSHYMTWDPCVVLYNDQLYIQYTIAVNYLHAQHDRSCCSLSTLLISLDDINDMDE